MSDFLPLAPMYTDIVCGHPEIPYSVVHRTHQCDGQRTIYVATHPRVGLLTLHHEAASYEFQTSLHLHANEVVHTDYKMVEVVDLPEASLQVLPILSRFRHQEEIFRKFVLAGEGVSIQLTCC